MSERFTDSIREIKQALDDRHEAQQLWQETHDNRVTKIEKTLAGVVDRIEEQESNCLLYTSPSPRDS